MPLYDRCAVKRCALLPTVRSRYCKTHQHRCTRYGAPEGSPMESQELRQYHAWIADGIARYGNRKGTHSAVRLAEELLAYVPAGNWRPGRDIRAQLDRLVRGGVEPVEIVQRVCEFFAYVEAHPHRFNSPRPQEQDHALARAVLSLRPVGSARTGAKMQRFLGEMLRGSLGPFALTLVRRLQKDDAERIARVRDSMNLDEVHTA